MGVLEIGLGQYVIDFANGYNEELHAVQGETARVYNFTVKDSTSEIVNNPKLDLYMTLYVKGKMAENIHGEYQEDGSYVLKIPQGHLLEADANAKYQLFIVNTETVQLLAQREGDFTIYPNRNFHGGGENLLLNFNELKIYMNKVLDIAENLDEVHDLTNKVKQAEDLLFLLEGMFTSSDMGIINSELRKVYEVIASLQKDNLGLKADMKKMATQIEASIYEIERIKTADGEYVTYSNGKVEYYINARREASINGNYGHLQFGRISIEFPIKFTERPVVLISEARYSTGIGWAIAEYGKTTTSSTELLIYNGLRAPTKDVVRVVAKVEGFVDLENYKL